MRPPRDVVLAGAGMLAGAAFTLFVNVKLSRDLERVEAYVNDLGPAAEVWGALEDHSAAVLALADDLDGLAGFLGWFAGPYHREHALLGILERRGNAARIADELIEEAKRRAAERQREKDEEALTAIGLMVSGPWAVADDEEGEGVRLNIPADGTGERISIPGDDRSDLVGELERFIRYNVAGDRR